jgi:three-Cys-motif partner protein
MLLTSMDQGSHKPHHFGSAHTLLKLEVIGKYLPAFTTALQGRFRRHYIDAFAGTGVCNVTVGGEELLVPGSASIAIQCEPRFDEIVFIEQAARKAAALDRLKIRAADRQITVIRADANNALPGCLARLGSGDRAIVFLDPFGMQVDWSTLEQIARSRVVDLWYLFPLSGLYRQATKDSAAIDADKEKALTRIFGTDEWRSAFYEPPRQQGLFGTQSDVRTAGVPEMLAWVKKRLEVIFPGVAEPKVLYQETQSRKPGAPIFALFFAVSNPSPKAKSLALRIARDIL